MTRMTLDLRCDCGGEFSMVFHFYDVAATEFLNQEQKRERCCPHCCKRQPLIEFQADLGYGFRRQ